MIRRGRGSRARNSGLTLIEILLAMIVLAIGIVGILALFPTAIESGKESTEHVTAAMLAGSIQSSLECAMKLAEADAVTGEYTVNFSHDIGSGADKLKYSFKLPKIADGWKLQPGNEAVALTSTSATDFEQKNGFNLGIDPWVASTVKNTRFYDASEPYDQYLFSFAVRKIDTLAYDQTIPVDEREKRTKLYEFRVMIFRAGGFQTGGTGVGTASDKTQIDRFHCKIAVR